MATTVNPGLGRPALPAWRRRAVPGARRSVVRYVAFGFLGIVVLCAIFGDLITPHDPDAQDLSSRLVHPAWSTGDWDHILGTDEVGRDVLSRIMVGCRLSLMIGLLGAGFEAVLGVVLGLLAGFRGGWVDRVVMRITDIQMGFPAPLIYLLIILVAGGAEPLIVAGALALNGWMLFGRMVRVSVQRLKEEGFVEAATASGVRPTKVVTRHVVPHIRGTVVTLFVFEVPRIIIAAAGLSFLGVGLQPPHIDWGVMLGGSDDLIRVAPYLTVIPGLMIVFTAVSMNVLATSLEPIFDPERRRR